MYCFISLVHLISTRHPQNNLPTHSLSFAWSLWNIQRTTSLLYCAMAQPMGGSNRPLLIWVWILPLLLFHCSKPIVLFSAFLCSFLFIPLFHLRDIYFVGFTLDNYMKSTFHQLHEHPYMPKTEKLGKYKKWQKVGEMAKKWQKKMANNFVLAESISRLWWEGIAMQDTVV